MSKSYEQLSGAVGRQRFFRPTRHDALTLFAGEPPVVWFGDRRFSLKNISTNGLGCRTDDENLPAELTPGVNDSLRLTQRGKELFRTEAVTARVALTAHGGFAGFALKDGNFNLLRLRADNARAVSPDVSSLSRTEKIPRKYKSFCADVLNFVADYTGRIDRFYAPIEAELDDALKNDIALELAAIAKAEWRELLVKGNQFALSAHEGKKSRARFKSFTESVVTPALLSGEGWARSYFKPMGYPGDYKIMNYIYDGHPVGDTIKTKFLHLLSLIWSDPVKSRMEYLGKAISSFAASRVEDEFHFLSIGAGSAREIHDIGRLAPKDKRLVATLIDQERDALEYAVSTAREEFSGDRLELTALNTSFKDMLNPVSSAAVFAKQDLIYSAGLVDYLNPLLAQRFVQRVYNYLKPGGRLIIGNLSDRKEGMIWPCEYVTDWSLYFRSEDEMLAMAAQVDNGVISLDTDEKGAIFFLIVDKPEAV